MYSASELAIKYLRYYLKASNGKGHGVHSPFVFNLIQKILNDNTSYPAYQRVEEARKKLTRSAETISIEDFGAGSTVMKSNTRKVGDIARSSLKPAKFSQLLFRLARYYHPKLIVELGTSLGITTSYLALAHEDTRVVTLEGSEAIAQQANATFKSLDVKNIQLIQGNFDNTLEPLLRSCGPVDLAFVDGNHRRDPTIRYFNQLLANASDLSLFIFDDIHWSEEMEAAWEEIKNHSTVTLTVDLFFIGLVFFRKEQKIKQHFTIRF